MRQRRLATRRRSLSRWRARRRPGDTADFATRPAVRGALELPVAELVGGRVGTQALVVWYERPALACQWVLESSRTDLANLARPHRAAPVLGSILGFFFLEGRA